MLLIIWKTTLTQDRLTSQRDLFNLFGDGKGGKLLFVELLKRLNISPPSRCLPTVHMLQALGLQGFLQYVGTWGLISWVKLGPCHRWKIMTELYLMLLLNWSYFPQICIFCYVFNTGYHIFCDGCNHFHSMAEFHLPSLEFMAFTLQSSRTDLKDGRLYIQQLALC